jgi:uncharacterized protein YigE (DUF2233 family)
MISQVFRGVVFCSLSQYTSRFREFAILARNRLSIFG